MGVLIQSISEKGLMLLVFSQLKMNWISLLQGTIPLETAESTAENLRRPSALWTITMHRRSKGAHRTTGTQPTDVTIVSSHTLLKNSARAGDPTSEPKTKLNQSAKDSAACHTLTSTMHSTL